MNDFLSQLGIAGIQGLNGIGQAQAQAQAQNSLYRYPFQMLNSYSAKPPFQQRREKAVEYAMEVRKRKGWIPCKI